MGGRAAEEIFFQDITSGASHDLMVAPNLAAIFEASPVAMLVFDAEAHVVRAFQEYRFRYSLYEQKVHEAYRDGSILIDVAGAVVVVDQWHNLDASSELVHSLVRLVQIAQYRRKTIVSSVCLAAIAGAVYFALAPRYSEPSASTAP